ncbi:hypothetical protein C900_00471 [Fulvivirga imtechensis AK7]|uniref:Uncharacterized protein n=1 Tax=Fulvivirga imtechensis AK7 TaxID=1237149 RepID=L8JLV9_9BACT|nr:hypothetical protein [Fulvivirga imtechensis]ELR68372.1 hypothetical protein C900_00471 [Fulvivirga imtechensis AK7]
MILAKYFWMLGSLVMGALGTAHMVYTFFTDKFLPRDEKLMEEMNKISPVLTKEISMWKAWIGFNASHSSGIMFLAIINCFLAMKYFPLLQKGHFYFIFNIITVGFYIFLAKKYWFAAPLIGVSIALVCYIVSYVLTIVSK